MGIGFWGTDFRGTNFRHLYPPDAAANRMAAGRNYRLPQLLGGARADRDEVRGSVSAQPSQHDALSQVSYPVRWCADAGDPVAGRSRGYLQLQDATGDSG